MGAGAVGCFFGGRLAQAGNDVVLIARGERLHALRENGLRIVEDGGTATIYPLEVTDNPVDAGIADVVLLCVKLFDIETAIEACRPLLGPETIVVTMQNGVDCVETVAQYVGAERVVGGAVWVVASMTGPAVVERTGSWAGIEIAAMSGESSDRAEAFATLCRQADIECTVRDDLACMLWSKFVLLAATSATTALTRRPIGDVREDPIALATARACIREAVTVAAARGVTLPADIEHTAMHRLCEEMAADAKASQLVDLEHGRPLELEYLSGAIHRMGLESNVPTPVHTTVYAALRPFLHGEALHARSRGESA